MGSTGCEKDPTTLGVLAAFAFWKEVGPAPSRSEYCDSFATSASTSGALMTPVSADVPGPMPGRELLERPG